MSFIRTVKTMVFDGALGRDPPPMRRPTRQSDVPIRRRPFHPQKSGRITRGSGSVSSQLARWWGGGEGETRDVLRKSEMLGLVNFSL